VILKRSPDLGFRCQTHLIFVFTWLASMQIHEWSLPGLLLNSGPHQLIGASQSITFLPEVWLVIRFFQSGQRERIMFIYKHQSYWSGLALPKESGKCRHSNHPTN
jgi:hypothetical protein